jgi:hypothetical protein
MILSWSNQKMWISKKEVKRMNVLNKSKCICRGILLPVLAVVCGFPSVVRATVETENGSLPATLTSYNDASVGVQQFDPGLGMLESVTIEANATGNFTQYYQNISTAAGDTIAVSQTLDMTLGLGSGTLLNLSQVNQQSYDVSAWNGSPPFLTGTAGGTAKYDVTAFNQTTLTSPADLAAFIGSGDIDLLLSAMAFGSVTDINGGNFFGGSSVTAGANLTVVYNYNTIPETSTWLPAGGIVLWFVTAGWMARGKNFHFLRRKQ